MSNFISGEDLLKHLDIRPFELFYHVKKGLQPFDQFGKPLLPPDMLSKLQQLKMLNNELESFDKRFRWQTNQVSAKEKFALIDTNPKYFSHEIDEYERLTPRREALPNEIETLKKELEQIEDEYSWGNYDLPNSENAAQTVIDLLLGSYFKRKDIPDIKLEKEFISGSKVLTKYNIEKYVLMNLIREGLQPWHPVYLKPIKRGFLPGLPSDFQGKVRPIKEIQHKTLPLAVYAIEEIYPFLDECLFLKEDVATIGKPVIYLDPEKLKYPERVKTEKLKIIKEIAATEDLKKLNELKQFDEDEIITANEWDDVSVGATTKEAFFDAMEIGKRESMSESIKIADSKLQSIRGKKGGEKPKKNQPIILAIMQYLQDHPKLEGKTNYQIAESFKRHVGKNEPIIVNFNECEWDVYFADNYIEAIADATNKKKNKNKSIAYSTFRNSYISETKKVIKKA